MNQIRIPVCTDETIEDATKALTEGALLFNKTTLNLYVVHKVGNYKTRTLVCGKLKQDHTIAGDNMLIDANVIKTLKDIDIDSLTLSPEGLDHPFKTSITFPARHNSDFLLFSKKDYEHFISGFFLLKYTGLSKKEMVTGTLHVAGGDNGYSLVSSTTKIPLAVVQVLMKDGQYYNGFRIPPREDGTKPASFQITINGFCNIDQDVIDMEYTDNDIVSFTTLTAQ